MLDARNYMPEITLLLLILTNALFLIKRNWTKKSIKLVNISFTLLVITCACFLISDMYFLKQHTLEGVFKLYFLSSAIYYIYMHSRRFHILERICISALCLGLFLIVSSVDTFVSFSAFSLCIVSVYGFTLTRERPGKDSITFVSILLITALLYGLNPFFSSIILLVSIMFFSLKTSNIDLEALTVNFLFPAVTYLLLRELMIGKDHQLICKSLVELGIITMIVPPILLIADINRSKNMAKFSVFYLGAIIFMLGSGTMDIKAVAVMMTLLFAFIYSPLSNPLTILGLAMLPPLTTFIARIPLLWAPLKIGLLTPIILVSLTSLAMAIFSGVELYRYYTSRENMRAPFPITLKIISIAVIIISVVYFNHINLTLEHAITALAK